MRGSAALRTGVTPGGALAGPWVRDPLWARARAVPSLDLRFADNKSLVDAVTGASLVTFTRASGGTFVGSNRVLQAAVTNLRTLSDAILTANSFGANVSTLTTVTTATPTASTTASLFTLNVGANTGNNTDGFNYGSGITLTNSTQHTQSLFVKPAGATILRLRSNVGGSLFDFTLTGNGTAPSISSDLQGASIVPLANGWYRVSWTFTSTTSAPGNRGDYWTIKTNVADGTNGLHVVGAQLEQSSTVGEYIPTTSTINSAPRFDHNPTTGESLGLLVEEARTNSITNNTMVGAVAGTPGTLPTGWPFQSAGVLGLAVSIVGTGAESGIAYLDWRISGTASANTSATICFGRGSALTAQTWTASSYLKLAAGSLSGVTGMTLDLIEETAVNVFIAGAQYSITLPTTAPLVTQRPAASRTLTGGATVALLRTNLSVNVSSGSTVDFTLRIGLPQLEQGAFATSAIPTTTAAATRNADVASIGSSAFTSFYNQTEGTVFADFRLNGIAAQSKVVNADAGAGFANSVDIYCISGIPRFDVWESSTAQAQLSPLPSSSIGVNTDSKTTGAYKLNDFAATRTGGTLVTDASGIIPTASRLVIGNQSSGNFLNGTIRRITFWPQALPSRLQTLTQ